MAPLSLTLCCTGSRSPCVQPQQQPELPEGQEQEGDGGGAGIVDGILVSLSQTPQKQKQNRRVNSFDSSAPSSASGRNCPIR